MYYAKHGGVCSADSLPAGAVELTREQYKGAIDRIAAGEKLAIVDGKVEWYLGKVQQVDADGFHVGEGEHEPGEPLIVDKPPESLVRPRWDGEWIEGATQADLDEAESERLETARDQARTRIRSAYAEAIASVCDPYPAAERETWSEQVEEAVAVQDGSTDAPLLQAIADARGLTLTEIAQRVLAKRATYKAVVGPATGKRQKLEQQIDAAETVEELDGIEW